MDPLDHVERIGVALDELGVRWVLGGSLASSIVGEPRSTVDIDIAVEISMADFDRFVRTVETDYYLPVDSARVAVREHSSFNLIGQADGFKIDVFVLGQTILDRRQIDRRQQLVVHTDRPISVWVGSPEDQILRKLWWFDLGGQTSDRQWGDIQSILRVQRGRIDLDDLADTAASVGLVALLKRALAEQGTGQRTDEH